MSAPVDSLIDELSAALADLVQVAQEGQSNSAEISSTLVDILGVLKSHKPGDSTDKLCSAIREIKPQVTVNVAPTPVTVNVERGSYKFSFSYDSQDRITSGTVIPIPANDRGKP